MRISDWSSDVCSSDLSWPAQAESCPPAASSGASRSASGQRPESRARRYNWGFPVYLSASASARARPGRGPKACPSKGLFTRSPHVAIHLHHERRQQDRRSEEYTSELQSLMRISYAVFCLKKKKYTHI